MKSSVLLVEARKFFHVSSLMPLTEIIRQMIIIVDLLLSNFQNNFHEFLSIFNRTFGVLPILLSF